MAGGGRRGGGDRVLESRHLVGLFLGVVLLCAVFFTLGYVMGHNQYGGPVHAAEVIERTVSAAHSPAKPSPHDAASPTEPEPASPTGEWDFYSKKNDDRLEPAAKVASPAPASAPSADNASARDAGPGVPTPAPANARTVPTSARLQTPAMPKGAIVLQIAALRHESDALAMADALQQKNFPAFVVTPISDNFYRVQVGPYRDQRAADAARATLDHAGFKAIIKR